MPAGGEPRQSTTSHVLFAHMYSGRIETEDVGTGGELTISLEAFNRDGGAFVVDTVVEVVMGADIAVERT